MRSPLRPPCRCDFSLKVCGLPANSVAWLRSSSTRKAAAIRINGSIRIWSQLIEGQYPAYEEAIPREYTGYGITCAERRLVQRRFAPRSPVKGSPLCRDGVVCRRNPGWCCVWAADAEGGIAAVERLAPARTQGSVPACGLRISYLSDALARLPDVSTVDVKFPEDKGCSPVVIQGPGVIRFRSVGSDHVVRTAGVI